MCDIALILADKGAITTAQEVMAEYFNKRQFPLLEALVTALFSDDIIPQKLLFPKGLIQKFRAN